MSKPRGFAAMDREKVRQIASSGGKAAHAKGTAHKWTPEEAMAAGKKGGSAAHKSRGRTRVTEPTVYIYEGEEETDASVLN